MWWAMGRSTTATCTPSAWLPLPGSATWHLTPLILLQVGTRLVSRFSHFLCKSHQWSRGLVHLLRAAWHIQIPSRYRMCQCRRSFRSQAALGADNSSACLTSVHPHLQTPALCMTLACMIAMLARVSAPVLILRPQPCSQYRKMCADQVLRASLLLCR